MRQKFTLDTGLISPIETHMNPIQMKLNTARKIMNEYLLNQKFDEHIYDPLFESQFYDFRAKLFASSARAMMTTETQVSLSLEH